MRHVIILLFVALYLWGCGMGGAGDPGSGRPVENKRILTQAILFKTAARIQEKYMEKYRDIYQDEQAKFYRFLDETVLSGKEIPPQKVKMFTGGSKYSECVKKITASDKSCWTIKKILEDHGIPEHVSKEGDVVFNPYVFLPTHIDSHTLTPDLDITSLWDLFYTAILLDETALLDKIHPLLIKKVAGELPKHRDLFDSLYQMHTTQTTGVYHADPLALYYLITGNTDERFRLSDVHSKRLREVTEYYDSNYYNTSYISVNAFTRENRVFMWLAARQREQSGDINKANVYIKTTFDEGVLRNIRKFHPNNQVYLYATIRIALKMHSPKMYRYVYGAMDPLTKFKYTKFKEFLKMQLLQLID